MWRWILAVALLFIPLALSVTPVMLRMGFWPSFVAFMICIMLMAAATMILYIFVIVRVQAKTPDERLGKVMAIIQAASQCAAPIGQLLYGVALQGFNNAVYLPLLIAGGLTVLIAFVGKAIFRNESI
jgi:predicted MFS family arabinose efflux permease